LFLEHARHDLNVALLTGFWMAIFLLIFWIKFKNKRKTYFVVEMPIINCRFSRTSASMLSKKTKALFFGVKLFSISIVLWF
jgi:hypothetical protein